MSGNPVQDRYDRFASSELHADGVYEVVNPGKAYFRARKLETAVRMGRFPHGARLLEVGCSVGQFTFPLAERGYAMHGVDLSGNSIEVARKRAEGRPESDPEPVAELMVRVAVSFLLNPVSCIELDDIDQTRAFARRYLVPLLDR